MTAWMPIDSQSPANVLVKAKVPKKPHAMLKTSVATVPLMIAWGATMQLLIQLPLLALSVPLEVPIIDRHVFTGTCL